MSEPSVRVSEPKVSRMVGLGFGSWNRLAVWLRHLDELKVALYAVA